MTYRQLWVAVLAGTALSLVVANRIVNQSLVIGSPEGGWSYGYLAGFNYGLLGPFLMAAALVAAGVATSWPVLHRLSNDARGGPADLFREWALVLGWCLAAVAIHGLLRSVTPHPLDAMFRSDMSNSFYSVALKFDVHSILGDFERLRPSWALHAQSNLPGKLLLVRALTHLSTRPDVLAWLIVVISSLGGVLVHIFVRDLFADRVFASLAAILYLFTPATFCFFPLLNTVTPVVTFACACLLMRWLHTGRTIYAALLGAAIYGLILFEPTALVVGVLFGVLLANALVTRQIDRGAAPRQFVAGIAGFVATYLIMNLWFGFDLVSAFRGVAADAVAFNESARRPYGIWIRQNVIDFLFGVGLCQMVLFFAALWDGLARLKDRPRSPEATSIVLVSGAIVAMVVAADLIGVNRGEVSRLWIFLACFWQIPAAYACRRLDSALAFSLVLVTTLLQNTLGTAMIAFVVP
jgi:hypothetical protein